MTETTVNELGVSINALRIDGKKVTAALFQQFESGCLLRDANLTGIVPGGHEVPFSILGRYSYKVDEDAQLEVPFLYFVNKEVRKSTLEAFQDNAREVLGNLDSIISDTQLLIEISTVVASDSMGGLKMLADKNLIEDPFYRKSFREWVPRFIENKVRSELSPSCVELLEKYGQAYSLIEPYPMSDEDELEVAEQHREEKTGAIEAAEKSVRDARVDERVQQWFEFNTDLMEKDLAAAQSLHILYTEMIDQIIGQIKNSPKLYIGV